MSDVPPPPDDVPEAASEDAPAAGGLWQSYRSLPVWLQFLAPLLVAALIFAGIVWATGGSDDESADDSTLEVVLKGLVVADRRDDSTVPTSTAPEGPPESTSPPSTTPTPTSASSTTTSTTTTTTTTTTSTTSTTTSSTTSTSTTTSAPTTTVPAPAAPTTRPPTTTAPPPTTTTTAPPTTPPPTTPPPTTPPPTTPPTTAAPQTTTAPTTSEPVRTTAAPETTQPPDTTAVVPPTTTPTEQGAGLPSVEAFFSRWNAATAGTDVPRIAGADARELTGEHAGYYVIPLPPNGSDHPPQVGLVGTLTAPGSGQLAEVMLAWMPGPDEDSSNFYWSCFDLLVRTVSPETNADQIAELAAALGRAPDTPPFTTTGDATSNGLGYRALVLPYSGEAGTMDISAIEIVDQ